MSRVVELWQARGRSLDEAEEVGHMMDLESSLNQVLEEHQHESGLHVIGGRRRLIDRLVQFFEEFRPEIVEARAGADQEREH